MTPNLIVAMSILINLTLLAVGAWVTYMFYARLRDIADELRKFRIAYEYAEDRKTKSTTPAPPRTDDDSSYLPKS
jgi:hypothetical protein